MLLVTLLLLRGRQVTGRATLNSAELNLLLEQQSSYERFVSVWSVEPGQAITLPAFVVDPGSGFVNWGDGGPDERCPPLPSPCRHVYAVGGLVRVSATMALAGWTMHEADQPTRDALVEIESWGKLLLHPSSGRHFYNCTKLRALPANAPLHTDKITSLEQSFALASALSSGGLGLWDTSNVVTLRGAFAMASAFDQDISGWDVSRVQDAGGAFVRAAKFNQPLPWHTKNLRDTTAMFAFAASFNQPLSSWWTGSITRANSMFMEASAFDQDLSAWRFGTSVTCRYFAQNSALTTAHLPQGLPAECV